MTVYLVTFFRLRFLTTFNDLKRFELQLIMHRIRSSFFNIERLGMKKLSY